MKTLKNIVITFSLLAIITPAQAQNLVPNPSFEEYSNCPDYYYQTVYLPGWNININTVDYFNKCSDSEYVSIPLNENGYQYPPDSVCSGYCGLIMYADYMENGREYLGTELNETLIIGQRYYISFKVSLADNHKYAINNIGILFTNRYFEEISGSNPFLDIWPAPMLNDFAHVYFDELITDKDKWTTIKGSFVADSAYQQIIIGNFFTDENTDVIQLDDGEFNTAYYYIDDVCVSTDSAYCWDYNFTCEPNSSKEILNNRLSIYPNPTEKYFNIEIQEFNSTEKPRIELYNAFGKLVLHKQLKNTETKLNVENLQTGLYFLKIQYNNKITIEKLVIK